MRPSIYGQSLPRGSCDSRERSEPLLNAPIPILHRVGFTARFRRRSAGELLPRLSILTRKPGGFFLLHFPWSRLRRVLPGTLPCGARTFLTHSQRARSPFLLKSIFIFQRLFRASCFCSNRDTSQLSRSGYTKFCRSSRTRRCRRWSRSS